MLVTLQCKETTLMHTFPFFPINMKVRRFTAQLRYSAIALILINAYSSRALAQNPHSHTPTAEQHDMTYDQRKKAGELVRIVRESTERFKDVSVAEAEGYALQFG